MADAIDTAAAIAATPTPDAPACGATDAQHALAHEIAEKIGKPLADFVADLVLKNAHIVHGLVAQDAHIPAVMEWIARFAQSGVARAAIPLIAAAIEAQGGTLAAEEAALVSAVATAAVSAAGHLG